MRRSGGAENQEIEGSKERWQKKPRQTPCGCFVGEEKVAYTAHEYPHEEGVAVDGVTVARSMGEDPACVFKTLVTQGASRNYFVFVIRWRPSWI